MKKARYFKFQIRKEPSSMYMVRGSEYMNVRIYEDNVEIVYDINSNTVKRYIKDNDLQEIEKGEFLLFLQKANDIINKKVF